MKKVVKKILLMLFSTILSISLRIQIDILVQERLVFVIIRYYKLISLLAEQRRANIWVEQPVTNIYN